jgi:hypothetical protein
MKKIKRAFEDKHLGNQINHRQNKVVWTHFKNEHRENRKEGFEHESNRKTLKTENKIKTGITGQEKCCTEGR